MVCVVANLCETAGAHPKLRVFNRGTGSQSDATVKSSLVFDDRLTCARTAVVGRYGTVGSCSVRDRRQHSHPIPRRS